MIMVAAVAALRGIDAWTVVRIPASFLLGPGAVQPPGFAAGDILVGLLMHVGLGILVGLVYAYLLPRLGISPIIGGLIAGAVLYILGFWALPLLFPVWLSAFWLSPVGKLLQVLAHAVYGVVLGWTYGRIAK